MSGKIVSFAGGALIAAVGLYLVGYGLQKAGLSNFL